MYDYVGALKESNPGSTIILGTKANVFEKFYSCFYAMKEGWKNGCRRILHLDGTFMKGKIKGEVLISVGRDANNTIFPVACFCWEQTKLGVVYDITIRELRPWSRKWSNSCFRSTEGSNSSKRICSSLLWA